MDTKSREFQYKVFQIILPPNNLKIRKSQKRESSLFTSHTTEERIPRLFCNTLWYNISGVLYSIQYIYSCNFKNAVPTRVLFLAKVEVVFEMERRITKERNKLALFPS